LSNWKERNDGSFGTEAKESQYLCQSSATLSCQQQIRFRKFQKTWTLPRKSTSNEGVGYFRKSTRVEFKYIIESLEKCQTIHVLNVSDNKITQGDSKKQDQKYFVQFLSHLPNLQQLTVSNTNVTADSLIEVLKNNKNLKILDTLDNDHLGGEGLLAICNCLTSEKTTSNLRELTITRLFTCRTKD
jgi:Ran GTPase-activating protein (RanGAP) involved in mRNA processing and transport